MEFIVLDLGRGDGTPENLAALLKDGYVIVAATEGLLIWRRHLHWRQTPERVKEGGE